MLPLFRLFYRWVAIPFALILLRVTRGFGNPKLKRLLSDRNGPTNMATASRSESIQGESKTPRPRPRPILLHAASGEVEYAKPLIRALRERSPQTPLILSYFSPSALRLIGDLPVDHVVPSPWDRRQDVETFLTTWNPCLVLISRTDVWPEFANAAQGRNIPVVLFSATFAKPLSQGSFLSRVFNRWRFEALRLILTVSATDEANLKSLGIRTPIETLGDSRFEQVLYRLAHAKPLPFRSQEDPRQVGVLGSTWPEDDRIWLETVGASDLRDRLRWIWVPHEAAPEKISGLIRELRSRGLSVEKMSEIEIWSSDVLLVDRVGYLAELYQRADFAFVGGSFKDKVHSVMEPLAAGCPVLVGPFHHNNREAIEFQNLNVEARKPGLTAVTTVHSSQDILQWLRTHQEHLGLPQVRENIISEIRRRAVVTENILKTLQERKIWSPL